MTYVVRHPCLGFSSTNCRFAGGVSFHPSVSTDMNASASVRHSVTALVYKLENPKVSMADSVCRSSNPLVTEGTA